MWKVVRERPLFVSETTKRLVDAAIIGGVTIVLLVFFRPSLLFARTTMTGGDIGGHVYAPWYLKTHLLPAGMVSGWSPDWYSGFPILHFYFPLIATFQAVLSYVMPYEIAFKLGTVAGIFFLPVGGYVMFRLLRCPFPIPILAATSLTAFLFMDSYQIYGGNIPSSMAGEYSFTLSLGLCLVFIGLVHRVARDHDPPVIAAAVVLALAALSHLVPVIVVVPVVGYYGYGALRSFGRARAIRRIGTMLAVAFALTAFWAIPFLVRLPYTANMRWGSVRDLAILAPRELWPYLAMAVAGGVVAVMRRDTRIAPVAILAGTGVGIFLLLPQGHVWNARFVPFWYIGVFLTAAYLVGAVIPFTARWVWRRSFRTVAVALVVGSSLAVTGAILMDKRHSYIDDWIDQNYHGYERNPNFGTFRRLMSRLNSLPKGRVMWESSPDLGRFGTPIALMSIPYWTRQATIEGIYFESSITTPFHFLTAAEISVKPSNPIPDLPYAKFDLDRGIEHMEALGVDYYLTFSERARAAALAESDGLRHIDDIEEFSIFGIVDAAVVVIPSYEPVRLVHEDWVRANVEWFADARNLDVPLVADGISRWESTASPTDPPRTRVEPTYGDIDVSLGENVVQFETTHVGKPHLVRVSYFPNWRAEGAEGPFLASPSMMIVVPTQSKVTLYYARTVYEWLGSLLSAGALVAVTVPGVRRRVRRWALASGGTG